MCIRDRLNVPDKMYSSKHVCYGCVLIFIPEIFPEKLLDMAAKAGHFAEMVPEQDITAVSYTHLLPFQTPR